MAVAIIVAMSMILSATALLVNLPVQVAADDINGEQVAARAPSTMIHMKNAKFDTAKGGPEMPSRLGIASYPDHVKGAYIIQHDGPITEEWKADITRAAGTPCPDTSAITRPNLPSSRGI